MQKPVVKFILLALCLSVASITLGHAQEQVEIKDSVSYSDSTTTTKIGKATYYSRNLEGTRTASGVRYRNKKFTAAHRSLPFGTKVHVTNLSNGKTVEVFINDRGPFIRKRIIDLSYAAARALGFHRKGVTKVAIRYLK